MHFAVRFRPTHLAGQDVAEGREGVVQRLVVDGLVHVLDEDVAHAGLPESRVTLRPHDADGPTLEDVVVHRVQGALRYR